MVYTYRELISNKKHTLYIFPVVTVVQNLFNT